MNIKKLNEEIKQALNELEIDPSFKDYVDNRREEQREPFKHSMDRLQRYSQESDSDDYWKQQYEKELKKYMGKQEVDNILKTIYNKVHIDLQNGGIKEITVPSSSSKAIQLLQDRNKALILKWGSYLVLVTINEWSDRKSLEAAWSNNQLSTIKSFVRDHSSGKVLDLTKHNSIAYALNKGLFDKAWLVYGGDTTEKRQQRYINYKGSKDDLRNSQNWNTDKSGYKLRNLKQELLNMTLNTRQHNFEEVKNKASEIRKDLINKIKTSDMEDFNVDVLHKITSGLKQIENSNLSSYSLDSANKSQQNLELKIKELTDLVQQL